MRTLSREEYARLCYWLGAVHGHLLALRELQVKVEDVVGDDQTLVKDLVRQLLLEEDAAWSLEHFLERAGFRREE